ncbi:MAG: hypothetical protein JWM16_3953 [Verrucomicrobiales bacterium]|nr:hypothetical protein [Verrucomicrobiales bacterium]
MQSACISAGARRERILVVDDVPANISVLAGVLEPEGYEILVASNGLTALKAAEKGQPDLILMDIMMPGLNGLETCRRLKEASATQHIPIIFVTARGEKESLVEAFRNGGVDYLVKPFEAEEALSRVQTHLRLARLTRELTLKNQALELRTKELTNEIGRRQNAETALKDADQKLTVLSDLEANRWNLTRLLGGSRQMQAVLGNIERLHQFTNTTVLITGESGTGKEMVARAIHFGSARTRAPFVPVNCVAIPSELAESMLFGHVKGAFTGATSDRKGYFELAHGGTLFLDEIGDMPTTLQVKLLRVLEDGFVTPIGASEAKKVDVRIIAATNADLAARIEDGRFRQDLYFRLARYQVETTPLRERPEDVELLALHFLRMFSAEMAMKAPVVSADALSILKSYHYPGNVRELRNIVEGALIESNGSVILPAHLHLLRQRMDAPPASKRNGKTQLAANLPLNLAEAEDILIQRALQETGGNIADAARMLGIHRTRIYRKLAQETAD